MDLDSDLIYHLILYQSSFRPQAIHLQNRNFLYAEGFECWFLGFFLSRQLSILGKETKLLMKQAHVYRYLPEFKRCSNFNLQLISS